VARYAQRFCRLHAGSHSVSSPLGAWLLLALVAPVSGGAERAELEDVLGADTRSATRALEPLLDDVPEVVRAALAVWGVRDWPAPLPPTVSTGPVPTQAEADAWARRNTDNLVEHFPVGVTGMTAVLASALATRISWRRPYEIADAAALGPAAGAARRASGGLAAALRSRRCAAAGD